MIFMSVLYNAPEEQRDGKQLYTTKKKTTTNTQDLVESYNKGLETVS